MSEARLARRDKIRVYFHPFQPGTLTLALGPYVSMGGESVNLTPTEASELAAWLMMMAGLAGNDAHDVSRMAETLRAKFDDLTNAVRILTAEEAKEVVNFDDPNGCVICGRIIKHEANMRRHMIAHGVHGTTLQQGDDDSAE